jgi:hypothetical protein
MLILQENVPSYLCPAVNSKSIALYYRCKLLPEGWTFQVLELGVMMGIPRIQSDYTAPKKFQILLTPSELLKIRVRLLSSNSILDFQLWAMILVACRLFLRED